MGMQAQHVTGGARRAGAAKQEPARQTRGSLMAFAQTYRKGRRTADGRGNMQMDNCVQLRRHTLTAPGQLMPRPLVGPSGH